MIDANKLSIGILLPIESYEGAIPKMENQVQLIQCAEALGYDSVWVRDIPLNNALRANGVEPNAITAEHSVILLRLEVYNGSHDSCRGGHGM